MNRYSFLAAGVLVTLVFLLLLITCRTTGLPVSEARKTDSPATLGAGHSGSFSFHVGVVQ